jgi:pyruvate carboxylase
MADIEALRAAQAAANGANEDVFEDEIGPKPGKTTHHIRANSTIMHLNKILGKSDQASKEV